MNFVKISDEKKFFHLPVENQKISLKTLRTYFEDARGLTYEFNGITHGVGNDNVELQLVSFVKEYKVYYSEEKVGTAKSKRDDTIMNIIEKHRNKLGISSSKKKVHTETTTTKVIVGWKHKKSELESSFLLMGEPVGGNKNLILNINESYSFNEIKALCIKCMKNEENENFFKNSTIELGTFKGHIFTNFTDEDDEECDFWEFSPKIRKKNSQLRLYLLTTKQLLPQGIIPDDSREVEHSELKSTSNPPFHSSKRPRNSENDDFVQPKSAKKDSLFKLPLKINHRKEAATVKVLEDISNAAGSAKPDAANVPKISQSANKSSSDVSTGVQSLNELPYPIQFKLAAKDDINFSYQLLGQGGYGTVQKATYCHEIVAVKTIRRGYNEKYIQREIYVMTQLRHSNIIAIKSAALDLTHCYIIMEYFDSVNLRSLIFDQATKNKYALVHDDKRYIAEQICRAVSYLHHPSINIVHEDLKPENILVDVNLKVKICDMGLSRTADLPSSLNTTIGSRHKGTPMYMSPELLLCQKPASVFSDVWALGCVLTELFLEKPIWPVYLFEHLEELFLRREVPNLEGIDKKLLDLFTSCFDYVPQQRPKSVSLLKVFETSCETDSSDDDLES